MFSDTEKQAKAKPRVKRAPSAIPPNRYKLGKNATEKISSKKNHSGKKIFGGKKRMDIKILGKNGDRWAYTVVRIVTRNATATGSMFVYVWMIVSRVLIGAREV